MIPEPLCVVIDEHGRPQWMKDWDPPLRAIIDSQNMRFAGHVLESGLVRFTFGGHPVVYQRIAYDIHGHWICDRIKP